MTNLILIFLAGGLGSLSRYGLGVWIRAITRGDFPYSTVVVNVVGCLSYGMVYGLVTHRGWLNQQQTLVLTVGFLGAFTTFSTFAFEAEVMIRGARWFQLGSYLLLQNVVGIGCVFLGDRLVR